MFSEYCKVPFEVEPVKINYPDGTSRMSPDMTPRATTASVSYINAALGLHLSPSEICTYLTRMSLHATPSPASPDEVLDVQIPPTRPDILHECDIMEDVGIAYGFNNLPKGLPPTNTVAKPLPLNKLGDILRRECASAGWVEVLPLILCSHDENFAHLNRKDGAPGSGAAIKLLNPATQEFQIVRTSLVPGLLKTLRENKALPLPLRIFECSDIAVQDSREERMSRNYRHLGAAVMDKRGGFEVVHGLLDRLMHILEVPFIGALKPEEREKAEHGYYIRETQDEMYFPGRAATIHYRPRPSTDASSTATPMGPLSTAGSALETVAQALKDALPSTTATASNGTQEKGDLQIGSLGILHPSVLDNFALVNPCSVLEINVEPFL
ncbi:hypothetical protein QFC24_004540 [Naganishia onofrii]|uniref:Uncharacterized protein n=1 Tax=Naganishia onofrii TaxID=1851511 RepID=A0ACC2XDG0_9TREE|nr:hypothetical protein QFC24_004540 [Naganishia onofrii]